MDSRVLRNGGREAVRLCYSVRMTHVNGVGPSGSPSAAGGADDSHNDARARARDILTGYVGHKGALLMALLDVQYQLNFIPELTVDDAAEILGYSQPEVWGVLSFYSDFSVGQGSDHFIDVCIDAPCHVSGARSIERAIRETVDAQDAGGVEVRAISCPRLCNQAPVVAYDQRWHGQLAPERAAALARDLLAAVPAGGA